MAMNHVFLGLGGAGVRTVDSLRSRLLKKYRGDNLRFFFVDSDAFVLERLGENHNAVLQHSDTMMLYPDDLEYTHHQNPRLKAKDVFARHAVSFTERMKELLNPFANDKVFMNGEPKICYWIVTGSCGFTGGGIAQDVLRLVNSIHREMFSDNVLCLTGLLCFMPGQYIKLSQSSPFLVGQYVDNASAFFSEFARAKELKDYSALPGICIPMDMENDKGDVFPSLDAMYDKAADILYTLEDYNVYSVIWSLRDIYVVRSMDDCEKGPDCFLTPIGLTTDKEDAKNVFFPLNDDGRDRSVMEKTIYICPANAYEESREHGSLNCLFVNDFNATEITYMAVRMCHSYKDYATVRFDRCR